MAKLTIYNIVNYVFFTITGYCFIDVLIFIFPFTDYQSSSLKLYGSGLVTILAAVFWIARLIAYRNSRKKEKIREDLQYKILELEIKIKEEQIRRSESNEDANKLLKIDEWK